MKRAILFAALLFLAFTQKEDWRLVGQGKTEKFYVDDQRTEHEGHVARRWEKQVPRDDTDEGKEFLKGQVAGLVRDVGEEKAAALAYTASESEYDCDKGLARFLRLRYLDSEGKVIYETPAKKLGGWKKPPSGSASEALMRDACEMQ